MEFWGVEVKAGEPLKCEPGLDKYVHLSQASLGESKKEKESAPIRLYVKVGDQKSVLGTLSAETCAQISYDLVFEKEFELSHSWKNGSVYFCGYKTMIQEESDDDVFTDSDEDEDIPITLKENGKPEAKEQQPKPAMDKANAAKPESSVPKKVKLMEPKKDEDDDDVSEEDESDEDMLELEDQSDDEEDEDESSEEEDEATPTPKKAESGKKRPAEPAAKTPVSEKKAKLVTPGIQKTGGKKGGHTDTPYPAKQAGKTPANSDKSKPQTPKSAGQFSCKPCNKNFNSDGALQSHNKAKHSDGK
ncbi:histone deacetylase HDT1-like [Tasmannia lanceolata]|uniref:histone deacetylase HDT1-like n=1 Tax=Tasmannia lanceolata TaxID=3420 RepID=UPI004062876D